MSTTDQFWAEEFDLSALTYAQFLAFFFDRPVVKVGEYELFRSGIDFFVASNAAIVVSHVQTMCRRLAELTGVYSREQLDQGLWAVFGAGISCEQYLFDPAVDPTLRIACIESMYLPFRDVVTQYDGDIREQFYWMWWDMILHTFWASTDQYKFDRSGLSADELTEKWRELALTHGYATLTNDLTQMAEAIFQTLLKILALDHRGCQWCALHGLGHLHHPLVRDAVQSYLDVHRNELDDADLRWVEACRDGGNM